MKLIVTFTLVLLAVCCSSASAETCPEFFHIMETLFMGTLSSYESSVEPFNPDPDMKEAGIQMKKLLDTLPVGIKMNVLKLSDKILKSPRCAGV
ncbi:uteroglobin [Ictidomys tridecemlineatus]|uniref:Uteroglobin n=1 Tax=Ictidomys tridecemlineatus TaxID=43179 RepID=I3MES7_ICTTR|nr:uteroglobin [Ictidomys tridecemlineatus]KAG3284880.1 secretoglobin family 1A member 1 [Ictidomys tridecemlineatus]